MNTMSDLQKLSAEVRYQLILMSKQGNTAHLGSSLSCVDLIVVAYWDYLNVFPNFIHKTLAPLHKNELKHKIVSSAPLLFSSWFNVHKKYTIEN